MYRKVLVLGYDCFFTGKRKNVRLNMRKLDKNLFLLYTLYEVNIKTVR